MERTWTYNPDQLKRLENEVHVWFVEPDAITDADSLAFCFSLLAPAERERYERFHFEKDRKRYLVAHALVRLALSSHAWTHPSDWRFSANAHGRPEIESPDIVPGLRFNLTHTVGLCACLVSLKWNCGVDAEEISRGHDLKKVAERMFAPQEQEAIGSIGDISSRERFFRHWTLREAYSKALGVGLAASPKNFHFEAVGSDQPRLIPGNNGDTADQWQFALLHPTDLHVVALAVHRPGVPDLKIVTQTIDL